MLTGQTSSVTFCVVNGCSVTGFLQGLINGDAILSLVTGGNSSSNGNSNSTSNTGGNSGNTDNQVPPTSSTTGSNGAAAPGAQLPQSSIHQEFVPGAAANYSRDGAAGGNSDGRQNASEAVQDPATFEGEFCVRMSQGYTLPPEKFTHTYYSSAGRRGEIWAGKASRGLVGTEGRLEAVTSASGVAIPAVEVLSAMSPVQSGAAMQVLMDHDLSAGNAFPQAAVVQTPVTSVVDWWRLAVYFSAATGMQGWWPTNLRSGKWSGLLRA
jgi:hypothetical protein